MQSIRSACRSFARLGLAVCAAAAMLTAPRDGRADSFPSRPLRIVVPAAAGGNLDLVSRNVAQKLSEQLGQQVIVENRPGGNYMLAVDAVARAPADGYTYLAIADSFLYTPAVVRTATYDPLKDFVGVSLVARIPLLLVVHPAVPAATAAQLIALAKRHPGELTYGTSGNGSTGHIAAALFSAMANIRMTHVPYKGNAPGLIDVMGGRTTLMFDTISTSAPHVKAGKLRAIGITSAARSPLAPGLATIDESGLPGYEATIFNGLVARAGTPPAILERLNAEIRRAAQQPDFRARLLDQGVELEASDSAQAFSSTLHDLSFKYARIVRDAGIRAD
ncbi:Tripartite-type tricarboxylate transporter, receptor component TctC [Variovorax sp. YR266]|uniref:tripartite tricarboxylate transporter substrate binding protein n=1 Tax=Variovorax sp. YR266 TaxID=1884386 RepID=UPI0008986C1C|nr:tripartite tricarboxylate transporter substrate binding protein [Variovorax sp. YR266]SDZ70341.1 Tripartite-type tricarboxylate transporter, receptor component TctC [Variovorax sp. YR266]